MVCNCTRAQMNTGYVHSSGALMLEPMGQQLIITVTKRGGAEPITITSNTPAAAVTSASHHACIHVRVHKIHVNVYKSKNKMSENVTGPEP